MLMPEFVVTLTNSDESVSTDVNIPTTVGLHTVDVVVDNRTGSFDGDIGMYIHADFSHNGRIFGTTCAKNVVDCSAATPISDLVFSNTDYWASYECTWDGTKFIGTGVTSGIIITAENVCFSDSVEVTVHVEFTDVTIYSDSYVTFFVGTDAAYELAEKTVPWSGTSYVETLTVPSGNIIGVLNIYVNTSPTMTATKAITNVVMS